MVPLAAVACAAVATLGARLVALRRRLRRLETLAVSDPLTGAFNRRHFDASLAVAVERRRRGGESAALLYIDVDRLKWINDGAGHAGGDDALKRVAACVRERLRKIDALFRIGGDEFAVLLAGASPAEAAVVAEDLRSRIAAVRTIDGTAVTISAGISELREHDSIEDWTTRADVALYHAKRAGRNRVLASPCETWPDIALTPSPVDAHTHRTSA